MCGESQKKVFPKITAIYILTFIIISWLMQILAISIAGNFSTLDNSVTQLQRTFLTVCMFVPSITLVIFCLFRKIGWNELGLRPLKLSYWIPALAIAWAVQAVMLFAVLQVSDFPNLIINEEGWRLKNVATILGQPNSPAVFILNIALSMTVTTIITIPQALGEELAWRGYLQGIFIKRFGIRTGLVLLGVIWSLFHLPANLAGYNHSQSPVLGAFIHMTITCVSLGIVFGWIRMKTNSVWPCAVGHAAYNVMETIIAMAQPRIDMGIYYFYRDGVIILAGAFFLWLVLRNRKPAHTAGT
jgi:membrane protease YdiL (CAAX protease family)